MDASIAAAPTTLEVIARVRPGSHNAPDVVSVSDDSQTLTLGGSSAQSFTFSHAAGPGASQEAMFDAAGKRVSDAALAGYNCCLFAYGQTGSGKTHTIYGPADGGRDPAARGLLPRILDYVFAQMRGAEEGSGGRLKFSCKVSFLEVRGARRAPLPPPFPPRKTKLTLPPSAPTLPSLPPPPPFPAPPDLQ
jgi:kinesin family protein 15